jgi:hypothetical protein
LCAMTGYRFFLAPRDAFAWGKGVFGNKSTNIFYACISRMCMDSFYITTTH